MFLKRKYVLLSAALCVFTILAEAQTQRQIKASRRDFIYVTAAAGYQSLLNEDNTIKDKGGAALELGVGYKLYYNHFIMSVGLEGRYGMYKVSPSDNMLTFSMVDSENDPFTMKAYINRRNDIIHAADIQVPLLFGVEFGHIYAMVGPKIGLNVYGSARTSAVVTTSATYDRFSDDFEGMPNHNLYENQPILSGRQSVSFRPQVYLAGEIGYRLGEVYTSTGADIPKPKTRYYIGAFFEYGFLNMHKAQALGDPISSVPNEQGGLTFGINPVYNTTAYADVVFRNFMAGVKFTVNFELPKAPVCVICKERERRNRQRGYRW